MPSAPHLATPRKPACLAALMLLLNPTLFAQTAPPPAPSPLIVIGFAGGFIKRTSTIHGEVALAQHLRQKYGSAIHAEIFENHHGDEAHREILRLVAQSHSRKPARIILYGHSWGASEAVDVARLLQRDHLPVLLLIEVDGVRKHQHNDAIIPSNVARAINFYQTEGLLHGRPALRAANPADTQIINNIQLSYKHDTVPTPGYPWFARTFTRQHIEIENDPRVWNQVEALIEANLPTQHLAHTQPANLLTTP